MKDAYCILPMSRDHIEGAIRAVSYSLVAHVSGIIFNGKWTGFEVTSFTYPMEMHKTVVYFKNQHISNTNFGFTTEDFK